MTERTLHATVTTTLSVVARDADGVETSTDADATPTAEIRLLGVLVREVGAGQVTHTGTGGYSFTWVSQDTGVHVIEWFFVVGGDDYTEIEKVRVVADVEGVSASTDPEAVPSGVPTLGEGAVCRVTGHFYDASGNGMLGVYVRFTPDRDTTAYITAGIVASEITASSDAYGLVDFYLVRGVTGILAITGVGITRRVTVPDTGAIALKDLADIGDDLLEVQTPRFKQLPRRS